MADHNLPPTPYGPRDEIIRVINMYIDAGVNVANMKRALRSILQDQPEMTPTESSYPQGLHPLVYDRLEGFSRFEALDGVPSDTKKILRQFENYIYLKSSPQKKAIQSCLKMGIHGGLEDLAMPVEPGSPDASFRHAR